MLGPCKGAAVKLYPAAKRKRLFVAEGIETILLPAAVSIHLDDETRVGLRIGGRPRELATDCRCRGVGHSR